MSSRDICRQNIKRTLDLSGMVLMKGQFASQVQHGFGENMETNLSDPIFFISTYVIPIGKQNF
jgi:hypothetical protein